MQNNVLDYSKYTNNTVKLADKDYRLSAKVPYTQDHVKINSKDFWNPRLRPEWFDVHHFGLDFDKVSLREADELKEVKLKGDLQGQRFKQNPAKKDIKSDVSIKGKDIRERPIIIVKDIDSKAVLYIQDGNTFYIVGEELEFPNYLTLEFYKNSNWSETNAIALGVYYNLLGKPSSEADSDDIQNALKTIAESSEFKELLENPDENYKIISKKLHDYWEMMLNVKKKKTVDIANIINDIIFGKTNKSQKLNPSNEEIKEDAKKQGLTDSHIIKFTVYSGFPEKLATSHWLTETNKLEDSSTLIRTIFKLSGAESHNSSWWIRKAYKVVTKVEEYKQFHAYLHDSPVQTKCCIAGVYQNHVASEHKFPLGTIVSVEQIKKWYKELGIEEENDIEENDTLNPFMNDD